MNATTANGQEGIVTKHEHDKHGQPTGHAYFQCPECGAEVMTGWGRDGLDHASGCPNGGDEQ